MAEIINTVDLTPTSTFGPDDGLWIYNGLDCCVTEEILQATLPMLDNISATTYTFSQELQAPVLEMMQRGLLVNQPRKHKVLREMRGKMAQLEEQLSTLITEGVGVSNVNWRSPIQLNNLLYDVMGLPEVKKRNANGVWARTSNREAVEKLSGYFIAESICNHIMLLRDLGKSVGFLETGLDADGRMRTNLNIAGTVTGRWSSSISDFGSGSNLQNIAPALRSVFVADSGYKLCNIDLEQADARNLGALCWNELVTRPDWTEANAGKYLDYCESGDLHTNVCKMSNPCLAWGTAPDREIADQIAYRDKSHRFLAKTLGHGCLTGDHEVLTRTGWVKISEIPEEIMTWSHSKSEFAKVVNWTDHLYTGQLQVYDGRMLSLIMTHDHRVPYYKDVTSGILHVHAAEEGPRSRIPLGDDYVGGAEEVPARMIAAVMCDGHQEKDWVLFNFHKHRKIIRLLELCKRYGLEVRKHGERYRVRGRFPKHPGAFMFNWTRECLREFIDELKHWDGHISQTAVSIHCSIREDLEWYQTFGRLIGIGGNIQKPRISGFGTTMYTLQQSNRKYTGSGIHHYPVEVVNIPVFCPTVPSSFFYVRHEGKICVTGNSNYYGQPPTMAKHSKLPVAMVKEFQDAYFALFPAIPAWHKSIQSALLHGAQLTTPFNRRRYFFGRPKDASTLREAIAHQPQSMTGDEINTGVLRLWRANRVQLLMQVHDSILFQYPEELEAEIIPWAMETLKVEIELAQGRKFHVPVEAITGWNWGYHSDTNPDGLKKWKGGDERKRQETSFKLSIFDH